MILAAVAYAAIVMAGNHRPERDALLYMQGFAMTQARLEMAAEMPSRWLDVMSVPAHRARFLRKTGRWWGETDVASVSHRVDIIVWMSGDLQQDLDTLIHELEHYIVVEVLGDWDMRSPMHNRIDQGFGGTGYTWWYHSTHPGETRTAEEK